MECLCILDCGFVLCCLTYAFCCSVLQLYAMFWVEILYSVFGCYLRWLFFPICDTSLCALCGLCFCVLIGHVGLYCGGCFGGDGAFGCWR